MKFLYLISSLLLMMGCSGEEMHDTRPMTDDSTLSTELISEAVLSPVLTYEQRQGKYLYLQYCAVCHGTEGAADGFNTYNLDPKPHSLADSAYVSALSDEALAQVIRLGGRGVNKSALMPPYDWTMNEAQIEYLVSYLRTLARSGNGK